MKNSDDDISLNNSVSVYASASASVASSLIEESLTSTEDCEPYLNTFRDDDDDGFTTDDKSSITSLVEEDLENKKRLLHNQAKRLLKKNKKLRKNYALTAENIINKTTSSSDLNNTCKIINRTQDNTNEMLGIRKSQRQRKNKFPVTLEFSKNDELSDASSEGSEPAKTQEKLIVQPIEIDSEGK